MHTFISKCRSACALEGVRGAAAHLRGALIPKYMQRVDAVIDNLHKAHACIIRKIKQINNIIMLSKKNACCWRNGTKTLKRTRTCKCKCARTRTCDAAQAQTHTHTCTPRHTYPVAVEETDKQQKTQKNKHTLHAHVHKTHTQKRVCSHKHTHAYAHTRVHVPSGALLKKRCNTEKRNNKWSYDCVWSTSRMRSVEMNSFCKIIYKTEKKEGKEKKREEKEHTALITYVLMCARLCTMSVLASQNV